MTRPRRDAAFDRFMAATLEPLPEPAAFVAAAIPRQIDTEAVSRAADAILNEVRSRPGDSAVFRRAITAALAGDDPVLHAAAEVLLALAGQVLAGGDVAGQEL